jgi:protein involved in polysaccharide export with SLBB domain
MDFMQQRSLLASSLALCVLGACHSTPLPRSSAPSTLSSTLSWDDVTLGPGDLLRVGVFAHPELSTPYGVQPSGTRVDPQGNLSMPLVGPIAVRGLTLQGAREAITAAFAEYVKDPRIDVSIVEQASRRFYLYGEVQKPGSFVLDRPLHLYQALALGGGFTPRASREEVVLLRGTPESLEVHVFDGETPGPAGLIALRADDFVFVRRSGAGRFSDEVLPYLSGVGSALGSAATLILIEDRIE